MTPIPRIVISNAFTTLTYRYFFAQHPMCVPNYVFVLARLGLVSKANRLIKVNLVLST